MPKSQSWPAAAAAQQAQASLPPEAVQSAGCSFLCNIPRKQEAELGSAVSPGCSCGCGGEGAPYYCPGINSHSFIQRETLGDNGKQTVSRHRVYTPREMIIKSWNQPNIYNSKMRWKAMRKRKLAKAEGAAAGFPELHFGE